MFLNKGDVCMYVCMYVRILETSYLAINYMLTRSYARNQNNANGRNQFILLIRLNESSFVNIVKCSFSLYCTADRNGGIEKRINNNYKSPTVGSESRSQTNCPEQRQISTITIEPIPTSITKSNPVFPGLVHKLNLPLIESPKSIDNIERRDQHNTLKTPFWQGRLSHPTRHRTNSQARMKRSVNGTYQRMKTITNELERYLRYVSQTIKY